MTVMCLTNSVAANFTANVLLAIGAKPAMVEESTEAAELAAVADATLINVGTLFPAQAAAMRAAVKVCAARHKPWVLDPVACQVLTYRRQFVMELISLQPTLIRGNHAEIDFLIGSNRDLPESVPMLSTGCVDLVYAGTPSVRGETVRVEGGVPMLQEVTATGCAQGAIAAAFLGWGQSPVQACLSASRLMKRAGERAFLAASRPGSFKNALLDALNDEIVNFR